MALADFGFGSLGLTIGDFTSPGKIVQLGVAPNRIDLLTAIDGVTFSDAWAHRVPGPFGSATVDYIGLRHRAPPRQQQSQSVALFFLQCARPVEHDG